MNVTEQNLRMLSGRLRALEQLMKVVLIDWAERYENPVATLDSARKYTMLTVQTQERPIDPATDLEADSMIDTLSEIFGGARAELVRREGEA